MGWWRTFLDSLDSDGGQIFVMVMLVAGCFWMLFYEPANMKAGELLSLAAGALIMKFKSAGSNREQSGSTTTVARVENVTTPEP
jgi:hypothetical protein